MHRFDLLLLTMIFWPSFTMATPDCESALYSSSTKQLSFSTLAVETYQPYTSQPDGKYTLCHVSGGFILFNAQPGGYQDFYFPYQQQFECNQQIEAINNCYPTFSALHRTLDFPQIKMSMKAMLPFNAIEIGTICYHTTLEQSAIRSGNFALVNAEEIACR